MHWSNPYPVARARITDRVLGVDDPLNFFGKAWEMAREEVGLDGRPWAIR